MKFIKSLFAKSTVSAVAPTKEIKQIIFEEPETPVEETPVEETPVEETPQQKALSFLEEMKLEAQLLIDGAEDKARTADMIEQHAEEEKQLIEKNAETLVGTLESDADAIEKAAIFYEQAQEAYDLAIKRLEETKVNSAKMIEETKDVARKKVVNAALKKSTAEQIAKAKIAEMRAARAAGLSYSEFKKQKENNK